LRREFRDVAIEAKKVFERFNMLGSCVNVVGTMMSTHASILVDSVGPPCAEVCRAAASFP
jgi:hypothetical protein